MKKLLLSFLLGVMIISFSNSLSAIPINFYLYNWEGGMKDTDNTLLKENDRVELLWAGANGIIDPVQADPGMSNFMSPSEDDILLRAYGVGEGIPQSYVPAGQYEGHIEAWVGNLDVTPYSGFGDAGTPYDDNFYVRFYNAADPATEFLTSGSVGWGESGMFHLTEPDLFGFSDDVNFAPSDIYITSVIPEPITMILLGLSLIGLRLLNRKK